MRTCDREPIVKGRVYYRLRRSGVDFCIEKVKVDHLGMYARMWYPYVKIECVVCDYVANQEGFGLTCGEAHKQLYKSFDKAKARAIRVIASEKRVLDKISEKLAAMTKKTMGSTHENEGNRC